MPLKSDTGNFRGIYEGIKSIKMYAPLKTKWVITSKYKLMGKWAENFLDINSRENTNSRKAWWNRGSVNYGGDGSLNPLRISSVKLLILWNVEKPWEITLCWNNFTKSYASAWEKPNHLLPNINFYPFVLNKNIWVTSLTFTTNGSFAGRISWVKFSLKWS